MRRIIICGSRGWHDREAISDRLTQLVFDFAPDYPVIVHGGARGADQIAGEEALKHGLLVEVHKPDYDRYKKGAPFVRNKAMASLGGDLCLAFHDGRSTGTLDMIKQAQAHGIPVEVILKKERA